MYSQGHSIRFTNLDAQNVWIKIYDTYSEESVDTTWHELTATGDPLHLTTINNEEYKFTPIRAQQATMQFTSKNDATISHFLGGGENRFYVEIDINETYKLFRGFLMVDDMAQPFLHPSNNLAVTLVATDNLGLLKDVDLSDFNDNVPRGKYQIIQYIAWALVKTGLELDIKVINSLYEENSPSAPFMQSMYLDAKTFEAEVGEREDCYSVLEKILGEGNVLMQHNGAWYILRLDEVQGEPDGVTYQVHNFGFEGNYQGGGQISIHQNIWKNESSNLKFKDEVYVRATRPAKELIETYSYDYPKELVDNIDFDRGALYFPLSMPPGTRKFVVDDWTAGNRFNGFPAYTTIYIQRNYVDEYEKERFVVIEKNLPQQNGTALFSNPIVMHRGDKFTFSIDRRLEINPSNDAPNNNDFFAQLRLIGADNTYWTCDSTKNGQWVKNNAIWSLNNRFIEHTWNPATDDEKDWMTASVNTQPLPVDGSIVIALLQTNNYGTQTATHFTNLQMSYMPLINGSYQKYRAQTWTVTNSEPDKYKKKAEGQVYISDSPKKLFKGALFKNLDYAKIFDGFGTMLGKVIQLNNVNLAAQFFSGQFILIGESGQNDGIHSVASVSYVAPNTRIVLSQELGVAVLNSQFTISKLMLGVYSLAGRFYNGFPSQPSQKRAYGEMQAINLWNQTNRVYRLFDFNTKGMTSLPSPLHPYKIQQQGEHTLGKWFMLLHMDQDWKNCTMSGVLAEVYDFNQPKTNDDKRAFKYITER